MSGAEGHRGEHRSDEGRRRRRQSAGGQTRPAARSGRRSAQRTQDRRTTPGSKGAVAHERGVRQRASGSRRGFARPKGSRSTSTKVSSFRRSSVILVFSAVIVVVAVIMAVTLTSGSPKRTSSLAPVTTPASPTVLKQLTGVGPSVMNAVGVPSSSAVQAPSVDMGQPVLTVTGKPAAFLITSEYGAPCAAERWAVIMAFSRFGAFARLKETTSSTWVSYPDTATFSFYGSSYSSNYVALHTIEIESNDTGPNGAGRHLLEQPNAQEKSLWDEYETHFGSTEGFPFLDIGNKVFVIGPSYSPQLLAGLNQSEIASKLTNPDDPVTQAIVGSANYLTAGICSVTQDQPSSVCSTSAVTQITRALSLG